MKRDMNLIRLLLLHEEGEEQVDLAAYSEDQKVYHSALVIEAGLVEGHILKDHEGHPRGAMSIRLTWKGHDFLDAARNESVWKKATDLIKSKGVTVTFDVLSELLTKTIKSQIGI